MKQNENNANKYKDILFSRTGRVDIVKMFIFFAKQSMDTKQSLSQYQVMSFFCGLEQIILKFAWDC